MSWITRGEAPIGAEEGYVVYLVGQHRERTLHNWAEEGGSNENGYSAKLMFHNPLIGENTCSVEIHDPNTNLQAPGKGPSTGSCEVKGRAISDMIYNLNSEYK